MAFEKTREKYKRKAQAWAETSRDLGQGAKEVAGETYDAVRGMKRLPWKKIPIEGWIYFFLLIVIVVVAAVFIAPYII